MIRRKRVVLSLITLISLQLPSLGAALQHAGFEKADLTSADFAAAEVDPGALEEALKASESLSEARENRDQLPRQM